MIEYIVISYAAMFLMGIRSIMFDSLDLREVALTILITAFAPLVFWWFLVVWAKTLWRLV